jgi:hypothetical protein
MARTDKKATEPRSTGGGGASRPAAGSPAPAAADQEHLPAAAESTERKRAASEPADRKRATAEAADREQPPAASEAAEQSAPEEKPMSAFAAAIERKKAAGQARSAHLDGSAKVGGATSNHKTSRTFRRKSG